VSDELIRPLWTRIPAAKMSLAAFPLAEALSFEAEPCQRLPPELDIATREMVIREALPDAILFHVQPGDHCDHDDPGRALFVVLIYGRVVCLRCLAELMSEEWDGVCVTCGEPADPHTLIVTRLDAGTPADGDALMAVAAVLGHAPSGEVGVVTHVCDECSAYWPRARPVPPGEPVVNYVRASVGGRPVEG